MTHTQIVGVGMVPFGKHPNDTLSNLGVKAIRAALADGEVEFSDIDAAFVATQWGGSMTGQRMLRNAGLLGMPIVNVENACSSGSTALHQAFVSILAGLHETVLVVGGDKLSTGEGALPRHAEDFEGQMGLVPPALYAMRARRYMHEYGVDISTISKVSVKNRKHAIHNPYAQFREEVTVEQVLQSRPVATPLTLLQCCARGDGAAALVLCSEKKARKFTSNGVHIAGVSLMSGRYMPGFRDMTVPEITVRCAAKVYEAAGLGPADVDMVETHDAFTIAELLYYEALGLCGPGEGGTMLEAGETMIGGRIPVNPSGGLLSKGHPTGATGLAQIVEAVWQLRGQCGDRQVEKARVALTHCTGGGVPGTDHGACTITIVQV